MGTAPTRTSTLTLLTVILASLTVILAPLTAARTAVAGIPPIDNPLVFVIQVPVSYTFGTISDIFGNFEGFYPPTDQPVGGHLYRLDPDGTLTHLTDRSNVAVRIRRSPRAGRR